MRAGGALTLLNATARPFVERWGWSGVEAAYGTRIDDWVLGPHAPVVGGDAHLLWAEWFVRRMCDPERHTPGPPDFACIYAEVRDAMRELGFQGTSDEQRALAIRVASLIQEDVARRRMGRLRTRISTSVKWQLWELGAPSGACWYCGARFDAANRDRFLDTANRPEGVEEPALFVDYVTGRGVTPRDLTIEVDHLRPVAGGGTGDIDNLRLACGWCNRHKLDHSQMYDAPGRAPAFNHPRLGRVTTPRGLWVVRLLATRRSCSFAGCNASISDGPVFVAPVVRRGEMNPINLQVVCLEHDPLGDDRWVPPATFRVGTQATQ
jgi:hypothetical protein